MYPSSTIHLLHAGGAFESNKAIVFNAWITTLQLYLMYLITPMPLEGAGAWYPTSTFATENWKTQFREATNDWFLH